MLLLTFVTFLAMKNGLRVKKYRGMGSLEAMTKGSDARYLGDTAKLKIAQGVVGSVADKGSVLKFVPYTIQAVKQGFQDLGASSMQSAHELLRSGTLRLEVRLLLCVCIFFLSHCYIVASCKFVLFYSRYSKSNFNSLSGSSGSNRSSTSRRRGSWSRRL